MKDKYDTKNLVSNFEEHANEFEKNRQKEIEDYIKKNPATELPKNLTQHFNISASLSSMCKEIEKIKNHLGIE